MPVTRLIIAGCLWLSALPACGLLFPRKSVPDEPEPPPNVSVEVESHNWSDIVIYLMHGNQPRRLGMVTALSTVSFEFPYHSIATGGNLRLRAYPIGGPGAYTSEDLLVQPGQGVKWTLESDLSRSFLAIY